MLVDPGLLATLPPEERAAGYAEVVKTALIAGGPLWERVAAGAPVDEAVVLACARTKLRVVAADERDGGLRQVLNLGHTVGHAIETTTGYARFRHGEAVGLGLLAALRLSGQDALRAQVAGAARRRRAADAAGRRRPGRGQRRDVAGQEAPRRRRAVRPRPRAGRRAARRVRGCRRPARRRARVDGA